MKKYLFVAYILIFLFLAFVAVKANLSMDEDPVKKSPKKEENKKAHEPQRDKAKSKSPVNNINLGKNNMSLAQIKLISDNYEIFTQYSVNVGNKSIKKKIYKIYAHDKYGLVDESGRKITRVKYDDFSIFDSERNIYQSFIGRKKGLLNSKGKILIPTKFESITRQGNSDYCIVKTLKYAGIYDINRGRVITHPIYNSIIPINERNWQIISRKKSGLIHYNDGEVTIIRPKYNKVVFNDGYILTILNRKLGIIDPFNGNIVVDPKYDTLTLINKTKEDNSYNLIFKTQIDNRYGVIFHSNSETTIIPPIYDDVKFEDNITKVLSNGYWRKLNNKGNVVL